MQCKFMSMIYRLQSVSYVVIMTVVFDNSSLTESESGVGTLNRRTNRHTVRQKDGRTDGQTDGHANLRAKRQTSKRADRQTDISI